MVGLRSYKTAWTWLHKFRRAMVRPGRERLQGTVEVDETYVGGEEEGASGRYTESKAIVAVAVEIIDERRLGRIRLRRIRDVSGGALQPFVSEGVEGGATVLTDGWSGYAGLAAPGYDHVVINRGSRSRGLLFYRLLEQAVQTDHTPMHALFKGTGRGRTSR